MSRTPAPRTGSGLRRTTVVVAVLAGAAVLVGCTAEPDRDTEPEPSASTAPVRKVDLSGLPVARASFCDMLDPDELEDALDGPVLDTYHYGNGDEAEITPGYTDVSHEYNCTFRGAPPATARTWVFARPARTDEARRLVRAAESEKRCTVAESLQFGTPTVTTACLEREPEPGTRVSTHGLFGDAWLSCELTVPRDPSRPPGQQRDEALERTEQWCVDVVTTIGARP